MEILCISFEFQKCLSQSRFGIDINAKDANVHALNICEHSVEFKVISKFGLFEIVSASF